MRIGTTIYGEYGNSSPNGVGGAVNNFLFKGNVHLKKTFQKRGVLLC